MTFSITFLVGIEIPRCFAIESSSLSDSTSISTLSFSFSTSGFSVSTLTGMEALMNTPLELISSFENTP